VRRLGCYGEMVAASHPSAGAACIWPDFASHDLCTRQWLPELSRKGTSASGDSKVTDEGVPAESSLPALMSKRYNAQV
jgi:hypothetical protein